MNLYLEEQAARDRMEEAQTMAAQDTLIQSLTQERRPIRVMLGYALIRMGRWVARREMKRVHPGRAAAA